MGGLGVWIRSDACGEFCYRSLLNPCVQLQALVAENK